MQIKMYTGKGGVGKTTVAAATACYLARTGRRVLIMSTDQAHSLGDSLDVKLTGEITQVTENLDALEIDTVRETEKAWGKIRGYMQLLLTNQSEETLETEELLAFPGFDELFSLLKMREIYDEDKYDVLIVDCAPTGETLSLLRFPEMLGNVIDQIVPWKRKAVQVVGPAVEKATKIPMPEDAVFDEILLLNKKLERLRTLIMNPDIMAIHIVTTPERVVILEAKRNYQYLQQNHYPVSGVVVNKVYPKEAMEGYFGKWMELQKTALEDIRATFAEEVPVLQMELKKKEIYTIGQLLEVARELYGKPKSQPLKNAGEKL